MRELERRVVLSVLDRKWREHLYEMDYLREGIYLRAYSQRDPLVEYQREGFDMFAAMMNGIKEESVGFLFNLEVSVDEEDDEEVEVEQEVAEPLRAEVPTASASAAAAAATREAPQIRARGLEAAKAPQKLTYSGPDEGVGELGDDNAAVRTRAGLQRRRPLRLHRPERGVPLRLGQEVQEVPRRTGWPDRPHRSRQRLTAAPAPGEPGGRAQRSCSRASKPPERYANSSAVACHRSDALLEPDRDRP